MYIRMATEDDAKALLKIYEEYIETPITFECSTPSVTEFKNRINGVLQKYPYLVAIEDNQIVGYIYCHEYRPREAFRYGVELSIYIDKAYSNKKIGHRLCNAFFPILKEMGVRTIYSAITSVNVGSIRFHEHLGFTFIGEFKNVGFKNGVWYDLSWYELNINPFDMASELLFIKDINYKKYIDEVNEVEQASN